MIQHLYIQHDHRFFGASSPMATFKSRKPCVVLILLIFHCPFLYPGTALSPEGTKAQQVQGGSPPLAGHDNMPVVSSPPFATPVTNKDAELGQSIDNQSLQSPVVNQQQRGLNNPQQSIDQNQPLSGFAQPLSSVNQPFLGVNSQPFSSSNQPFEVGNQQGLVGNAPFESGTSKEKRLTTGLAPALVSLIVTLGLVV